MPGSLWYCAYVNLENSAGKSTLATHPKWNQKLKIIWQGAVQLEKNGSLFSHCSSMKIPEKESECWAYWANGANGALNLPRKEKIKRILEVGRVPFVSRVQMEFCYLDLDPQPLAWPSADGNSCVTWFSIRILQALKIAEMLPEKKKISDQSPWWTLMENSSTKS